jgi:hypothetical protein
MVDDVDTFTWYFSAPGTSSQFRDSEDAVTDVIARFVGVAAGYVSAVG